MAARRWRRQRGGGGSNSGGSVVAVEAAWRHFSSISRIFLFSETKIPISAAGFWSRSTGKMVDSPPPAVGSHRTGYSSNALDLARRAMPYLPLTDFFPPLPDHSPHPQDVGATHRRVDLIYPRSPPPSIKCPASKTLLQGMGRRRTRSRCRLLMDMPK